MAQLGISRYMAHALKVEVEGLDSRWSGLTERSEAYAPQPISSWPDSAHVTMSIHNCHTSKINNLRNDFLRLFMVTRSESVWLDGLVVSALGIGARGPGFDSRVVPLFHWIASLGKLLTHIASPVSQLQETGVQNSFRRLGGYGD